MILAAAMVRKEVRKRRGENAAAYTWATLEGAAVVRDYPTALGVYLIVPGP